MGLVNRWHLASEGVFGCQVHTDDFLATIQKDGATELHEAFSSQFGHSFLY